MATSLVIALLILLTIAAAGRTSSGVAPTSPARHKAAPESCRSARMAVPWYRFWVHLRQTEREAARLADETPIVRGKSCRWARFAAHEWRDDARLARHVTEAWLESMLEPEFAIRHYFGEHADEAIAVAGCESHLRTTAVNGQYLGLFQMGDYARRLYGHGRTARAQVRAAAAYFFASGADWSPWSCKP